MSEITIEKYMIEITTYPNGKKYQKIYPVGQAQTVRREDANAKKLEAQKRLDEVKKSYEFKVEGVREI